MITKELTDYIKNKLAQGIAREALKRLLISNGWEEGDVAEAFDFLSPKPVSSFSSTPEVSPVISPVVPVVIENITPKASVINNFTPIIQDSTPKIEPVKIESPVFPAPIATPVVSPFTPNIKTGEPSSFMVKTNPQPEQKIQLKHDPLLVKTSPMSSSVQALSETKSQLFSYRSSTVPPLSSFEVKSSLINPAPKTTSTSFDKNAGDLVPTADIEKNPMLIKNASTPNVMPAKFKTLQKPVSVPPVIKKPIVPENLPVQKMTSTTPLSPVNQHPSVPVFSSRPLPQTNNVSPVSHQTPPTIGSSVVPPSTAVKIPITTPTQNQTPRPVLSPLQPNKFTHPIVPPSATSQNITRPVPIKPTMKEIPVSQTVAAVNISKTPSLTPTLKSDMKIETPAHHGKVRKTLLAVLIILGLLGSGAYGYFFLLKGAGKIEKEIGSAFSSVNSFKFTVSADVSVLSSKNGAERDLSSTPASDHFIFKGEGIYDESEKDNPKLDSTLAVTAPVLFDKPYSASIKMIGSNLYLSLPPVGLLELFIPEDLAPSEGKWINVTGEDLKQLAVLKPDLKNFVLSRKGEPRTNIFSATEIENIKKIWSDSRSIILGEKTGTETISGVVTDHYHFTLNEVSFWRAISQIKSEVFGMRAEAADADVIAGQIKNTRIGGGDIWIGKDFLPYKIAFGIENLDPETHITDTSTVVTIFLSEFNEKKPIVAPLETDTVLLQNIISQLSERGSQSDAKNLLSAAQKSAQVFSEVNNGKYNGICTSKNGFLDLLKDVAKNNGGVKPHCNSSKDSWIIFMQYGADKNTYMCLDATGANKEVQGPIIGITCPLN